MTRQTIAEISSVEEEYSLVDASHSEEEHGSTEQTSNANPVSPYMPNRIWSNGFGLSIQTRLKAEFDDTDRSNTKKLETTIIKSTLLIPGDGDPIKEAALVVENKTIAWIGRQSQVPKEYTDRPHRVFSVPYVMPGLWDVHAHFMGESRNEEEAASGYLAFITEHPVSSGARLARECWESLQWGYTSLRDVAGYGCEVSRAIDDGTIIGPNIYSSGACLSQLAGHGDVFNLPAGEVLMNLGVSDIRAGHFGTGLTVIADGVAECRRAVRLQVRRGAKCIKILASGGVMSRDDNPLYAQFSEEELVAIMEEANRFERSVAAHVHGKPGIIAAVKAGVRTVEHVSMADQECIDLIKEKGTIYVATRAVIQLLMDTGGVGLPKKLWEKAQLVATNHETAYKLAVKAGITCALGTDTPPGFPKQAVELEYAVKAGMTNLEAIKAATANGPLTVAGQVGKTGQLKVGYEADILGLQANPVQDVKVLQVKENIKYVWKGGKLFKGPGVGPWGEA